MTDISALIPNAQDIDQIVHANKLADYLLWMDNDFGFYLGEREQRFLHGMWNAEEPPTPSDWEWLRQLADRCETCRVKYENTPPPPSKLPW